MSAIVKIVYSIKNKVPFLYSLIELCKKVYIYIFYSSQIKRMLITARIDGSIGGKSGFIRSVIKEDAEKLHEFFQNIPEDYLTYFHPHGFELKSLNQVIKSIDTLTYGLFMDESIIAYCLLKLFPGKKAYVGFLVSEDITGKGIGTFLIRYLYWQCYLLNFKPYSTVNENNITSLRAHQKARPYKIVDKLNNGYILISSSLGEENKKAPSLDF